MSQQWFRYQAVDLAGYRVKGVMKEQSLPALKAALERLDLQVRFVKRMGWFRQIVYHVHLFIQRHTPIPHRALLLFSSQMSIFLSAHFPIDRALLTLARTNPSKKVSSVLFKVYEKIKSGASLYHAFSGHPAFFNDLFLTSLKNVEQINLRVVFQQLKESQLQKYKIRKSIWLPAVPPIGLLILAFIFGAYIETQWLPPMQEVLKEWNQVLPPKLQFFVDMGRWITYYSLPMFLFFSAGVLACRTLFRAFSKIKFLWERFLLSIPIIKTLIRAQELLAFLQTFYFALQNGIHTQEAFSIATEMVRNSVMKRELVLGIQRMRSGEHFETAFKRSRFFSSVEYQFLSTGFHSGNMKEVSTFTFQVATDRIESITVRQREALRITAWFVAVGALFYLAAIVESIYSTMVSIV